MKTVAQLASGKKPVGTTAYLGRVEHLMQCRSNVQKGWSVHVSFSKITILSVHSLFPSFRGVYNKCGWHWCCEKWDWVGTICIVFIRVVIDKLFKRVSHKLIVIFFKNKVMIFEFFSAAEDWLKPSEVLEAFEARATRMSVACAKNLSKFANQEDGISYIFPCKVEDM